jgi:Ca-activated chloride channel family protein
MIAFDTQWVLIAAPFVAVLFTALAWWVRAARIKRANRWSEELAAVATKSGRRGAIGIGLAAFLVMASLAGPRFGGRVVTTEMKALNLVVAVDISRSMLAEDVSPSRLGKTQDVAHRLIQDLAGDRVGLIAFAGRSWILSPLTVDAGALRLLVDGLHPDLASEGGTSFAPALRQAHQLLLAGDGVADRVLVMFTDGEELDSVPQVIEAARDLERDGIRLILVAEGGNEPARIPLRDPNGVLLGYHRDIDNAVVQTRRRDDILSRIADVAGGAPLVSAEVGDQAGAIRNIVTDYKRSPQATTTSRQDISRAWMLATAAVLVLLFQTLTRRTAALAGIALLMFSPRAAFAQHAPNPADEAWKAGRFERAATFWRQQYQVGNGGDTTLFNLGTAALALGDTATARTALGQVRQSLDPDLRFKALYNLGLLELRAARSDTADVRDRMDVVKQLYREALLLRPGDQAAKWNYELATALAPPPPPGGGQSPPPQQSQGSPDEADQTPRQGLTRDQAEQILNSMLEEERRTREAVDRRNRRGRNQRRRKDW